MRSNYLNSDLQFLEQWRAGDIGAGAALFSAHIPGLLRYFRRYAADDAEELLQVSLLACVENQQRFRGDATFRTYLFTIARHALYRHFRERARRRCQVPVDDVTLIDSELDSVERLAERQLQAALRHAFAQLGPLDRSLLQRFYADDVDSQDLAMEHGIKPSSVRARLHRARRLLAQRIRSEESPTRLQLSPPAA
jgi:RNA polymerase sigma factor (sigma-70 family)